MIYAMSIKFYAVCMNTSKMYALQTQHSDPEYKRRRLLAVSVLTVHTGKNLAK
jgi:hypothetical protein